MKTLTTYKETRITFRYSLQLTAIFLLLVLWIFVFIDKITDYKQFKFDVFRQPLPNRLADIAIIVLPLTELATIILIICERTRILGYVISAMLMFIYTLYAGIGYLNDWDTLYCGCGKVISSITWGQHFWINAFFLFISICAILLIIRQRANRAQGLVVEG